MNEEKIIMRDSPEAAQLKTVTGWVSLDGIFYGKDESTARYAGCTHQKCQGCEEITHKHSLYCSKCQDQKARERYKAMPKKEWDGVVMLYSQLLGEYGSDPEEMLEQANENIGEGDQLLMLEDLMLVLCIPVYAAELSHDNFYDDLPEDGEMPAELEAAVDAFNEAIKNFAPLSYQPGNFAMILPSEELP